MSTVHINIGSNLGDRAALIERAVAALCERIDPDGDAEIRLAPVVESDPWGFDSANRFLNLGLMVRTDKELEPQVILDMLQETEREIDNHSHRDSDGHYIDRAIDIDLIAVDDKIVDSPTLQLPHPFMDKRDFVLRPIAMLDPVWSHPLTGKTAQEMISEL